MYEVYLQAADERDLKRLYSEIFHRIIENINVLRVNPRSPGCRKIKNSKNDWRIRLGSHRIIYEVDGNSRAVKILRIRYRREAY